VHLINETSDQLSHVKIGKRQLRVLMKTPTLIAQLAPSFLPMKNMLSHISQYKFAAHLLEHYKILDIACGAGYGSEILRLKGNTVTGVDINPENVRFAKQNFPKNEYLFGDAQELNQFESSIFDAIVSIQTIEHLDHPKRAINEFHRLLKPYGKLIGAIPINSRHELGLNAEANNVYLFNDCNKLISPIFPTIEWYYHELEKNQINKRDKTSIEGRDLRGDYLFVAIKE
jgi:2-polyprenyl-3-methyl-5-hydroxy-6-metoxy-1,4-benzoquinol methylase